MTLVVCRKIGKDFFVHSDSKVTDEFGVSLESDLRQNSPLTGLLKTVFLHPHICLSFAGRSSFATDFLKRFLAEDIKSWNTPKLLQALWDAHERSKHECDFVLCEAVDRKPQITLIKDGQLATDLEQAWIGSREAFSAYQKAFHASDEEQALYLRMRMAFRSVIDDPEIEEVGHFHIEAYLDHHIREAHQDSIFLYEWKAESETGSQVFHIEANVPTALQTGSAQYGAYGTSYFRSMSTKRHAVAVHFPYASFGVLMCPQVDCEKPVLIRECSAKQFVETIWNDYRIALEGVDISGSGFRLLKNYQ